MGLQKAASFFKTNEDSRLESLNKIYVYILQGSDKEVLDEVRSMHRRLMRKTAVSDLLTDKTEITLPGNIQATISPLELICNQLNGPLYRKLRLAFMDFGIDFPTSPVTPNEETVDLSNLVTAINEQSGLDEMLKSFKDQLATSIKKGRFPIKTFLEAYDVYAKQYDNWDTKQCAQFSKYVLGHLQLTAPAWLKQIIAQGIHNVTVLKQPLKHSFNLARSGSIEDDHLSTSHSIDIFGVKCPGVPTPLSDAGRRELASLVEKQSRIFTSQAMLQRAQTAPILRRY